jgi:hypothetical protein
MVRVRDRSTTVKFSTLLDQGLLDLMPGYRNVARSWKSKDCVDDLRHVLFGFTPQYLTEDEFGLARKLADCFGSTFQFPVLLALLGLHARSWDDRIVLSYQGR